MVLDTSAVVAILRNEADRDVLLQAIESDPVRLFSAVSEVEAGMVLESRAGPEAGAALDLFLYKAQVKVMPFDSRQSEIARRAWRKFGKGNHPARLNFGDCCVYALARVTGERILCKGQDFARADCDLVRLVAGG
jgi:ribonuclease VapC